MQELLSIEWASSSGERRYCFPRKTKLENAKLINEMRKYYMKTKVTDLFFYFWGWVIFSGSHSNIRNSKQKWNFKSSPDICVGVRMG